MHGAAATDVLLLDAEDAADLAVLLAVPERAVVDFVVVAGSRPPAGELARGRLDCAIVAGNRVLGYEIHVGLRCVRARRPAFHKAKRAQNASPKHHVSCENLVLAEAPRAVQ